MGKTGATDRVYLGVDIGSATVKVAGVDDRGEPAGSPVYLRHDQFPSQVEALKHALSRYLESLPPGCRVGGAGTTGSGRELNKKIIGADISRTEIFAHAAGIAYLLRRGGLPADRVGTVIEIGGQDAKVIVFDDRGIPVFFNMNTICSAGTGEFLKQLADEADIPLAELGPTALRSRVPAHIDATCTVFSKRDFRHLTQKGVPLEDRLMGVCRAMVRNYLRNVVRDIPLREPVFFQGGVAFNQGVRRAFEEALGCPVYVTPQNDVVGALGMAVIVRDHMSGNPALLPGFREDFFQRRYESRIRYCHGCPNACDLTQPYEVVGDEEVVLDTLGGRCEGCRNPRNVKPHPQGMSRLSLPVIRTARRERVFDILTPFPSRRSSRGMLFAGIDGGSRGTKWAIIRSLTEGEPEVEIVGAGAVDTGGDALRALFRVLEEISRSLPPGAELGGVATTGSAGELFRDVITEREKDTSDVRVTEIIAHYAWASYWLPGVGTVMDIGGNDTKLIAVGERGLDFAMNDKCAAGTGSFLEAVARRFGVPIGRFGEVALASRSPARIAGRCAVFGESDIVHKSRIGFAPEDLFLGLAYAICRTYLSDVGRGKPLRLPVVAQGGGFLNSALQKAFRDTLELGPEEFVVHEDPRYVLCAGALGAALLARARYEEGMDSGFKGFPRLFSSTYRTVSTNCSFPGCGRSCRGLVLLLEDGKPLAGYKSIDCRFGFFDGRVEEGEEKEYMEELWRSEEEVFAVR